MVGSYGTLVLRVNRPSDGFKRRKKMKFTSNTQEFLVACNKAVRAAQRNSTEMSEKLLIEVEAGYGAVRGYDLITGISAMFDIKPELDGKIAIDAKTLCGILKKAPSESVSLETNGETVTIKSGRSRFSLQGLSAEHFPQIPLVEGDSIKLSADELSRMTRLTSFAAAKDDSKAQYKGIEISFNYSELSFTALDGYRLAKATEAIEAGATGSYIVPATAMNEVARLLSGEVQVTLGDKHAEFSDGTCSVFARLLDGRFQNFDNAIPHRAVCAEVDRTALAEAVERVSVTLDTTFISPIECTIRDGKIELSSRASIGTSSDSVECDTDGTVKIGLNHRYLLDALKAADTQRVKITLENPLKPVLIEPVGEGGFKYIVLPVRLKQ